MSDDTKVETEKTLPPYPDVLFPWSESDKEQLIFKGNVDDLTDRMRFKMYNMWLMWADLRNNEQLINIVGKTDKDEDKDFFYTKNIIVTAIDRMGKILCNTDLIKELVKTDE